MTENVVGAVLLVVGVAASIRLARARAGVPGPGWFPDPSTDVARQRFWDGRAWTGALRAGGPRAERGRRFHGRFWGGWVWYLLAAVVIVGGGSALYLSTDNIQVMAATSLLGMAAVCWAFYRFVDRQLALDDVIDPLQVVAVAVGTGGAVLLIAANVNTWIIDGPGITTATALVGLVEEGTKVLVPLLLFALGLYRDPRAGVALGLASGFGFAVVETTQYAYAVATASGPNFCGTPTSDPTASGVVSAQVFRIALVSPLHWLWTGVAVTIAWRLWHLYGRRGTWGAAGGLLMVMVVHSLNDSSSTAFCDDETASSLSVLVRWVLLPVMYLVLKAWARKSTPPPLVGKVSRGWVPKNLPGAAVEAQPEADEPERSPAR